MTYSYIHQSERHEERFPSPIIMAILLTTSFTTEEFGIEKYHFSNCGITCFGRSTL